MSSLQKQLEDGMDKYLVKKAPFQIPSNGKRAIVEWAPWIALVIGILSVLSALSLWGLAKEADRLVDYSYDVSQYFGVESTARGVSAMVYVSIAVLLAQGAILVAAFRGLQAKSKPRGWNLLLLSTLLGLVYGASILFISDYRSTSDFVFSIIGTVVGLYILAQIKNSYANGKAKAATKSAK